MYEIKEQLKNLKLPDICVSDGKEYFLDPVRDKMILKTPEEEIRQEEGEYDGSVITLANEQEAYNPYIQIHRFSKDIPHLTNTLNITNLSMRGWEVRGSIESIKQDDNVTIYHCKNSFFTFDVVVTAHILFWYDENTPIYKE